MNTETVTDTYTVSVTVEDDWAGLRTVRVSALVQDGRSVGPYVMESTFGNVSVRDALVGFTRELSRLGRDVHPDTY